LPYKTLLITGLLFLALKLLLIDRLETPIRREAGPVVENTVIVRANELQLAGYNLQAESVAAGETFDIDLAWQTFSQPAVNYQSNVWLVGPEGQVWSEKETNRPRIYETTAPTTLWVGGQWAWDSREVQVLPGTPPGEYDIVLTLFHLADLQPVTLLEADGSVRGPTAVIGQITVTTPSQPPEFNPQFALEAETAGLHLLGYNQDRAEAIPGEQLLLTFFWEKAATVEPESRPTALQLTLQDKAGQTVQSWTIPPVSADYPPAAWQPGERLRGQHGLRLAAGLASGQYQFRLEDIELGMLSVTAPERLFSQPPFETAVGANFGDQIELVGYTLETAGESLSATLIWQALAEMPTSYRVFVHLVNESGQIVAQADGEPAAWTRPTTGWAAGEYIVDRYVLPQPENGEGETVVLRVGLYDPDTGLRLMTGTAEFVFLQSE
jgi:hypothetical protein